VPPLQHFFARNAAPAAGAPSTPVLDAVTELWHSVATAQPAAAVEHSVRLAKLPPTSFLATDWQQALGGTGALTQALQDVAGDAAGLYEQQGALLCAVWRNSHSAAAAAAAIKELYRFQQAHAGVPLDRRMRYMAPAVQVGAR
jgi:hypothetical protein